MNTLVGKVGGIQMYMCIMVLFPGITAYHVMC